MACYYAILWAVTLLNVLRCLLQVAQAVRSNPGPWNALWLTMRFGE